MSTHRRKIVLDNCPHNVFCLKSSLSDFECSSAIDEYIFLEHTEKNITIKFHSKLQAKKINKTLKAKNRCEKHLETMWKLVYVQHLVVQRLLNCLELFSQTYRLCGRPSGVFVLQAMSLEHSHRKGIAHSFFFFLILLNKSNDYMIYLCISLLLLKGSLYTI